MENTTTKKEKHGCVTAYLVFMIIANAFSAIANIVMIEDVTRALNLDSSLPIILLCLLGVANIFFAFQLFQWKKMGFYGFAISAGITFIINLTIGNSIAMSLFGLAGIAILYAVLNIKKDGVDSWSQLD